MKFADTSTMTARVRGPLVGCVLFLIYAASSGRSVGWEDSAFFQLAHATLGVPHGPGFPLYVLLGRVWILFFPGATAWGSTLLSALAMAAAGVVLLETLLLVTANQAVNEEHPARDPWVAAAAVGVVLSWGCLESVWRQAVRAEVYALALLLALLTAYFSLKAVRALSVDTGRACRLAVVAAFAWGMGMAVHPLVVLAAGTPWLLSLIPHFRHHRHCLTMAIVAGLLPAGLYLYPFLRGRLPGVWAWGDFSTWASALDYYLRRSAWAAVSTPDGYLLENLRGWLFALRNIWPFAITLTGLVAMIWLRRTWALPAAVFTVLGLVVWAAPFSTDNLDLWGYFLPAGAMLVLAAGVLVLRAVRFLREQMPGLTPASRQALGFFCVALLVGWPGVAVYSADDLWRSEGSGEFMHALVGSLPDHALVLVADDNLLGPLEYALRVEHDRPDVRFVALGALRFPFYRLRVRDLLPTAPDSLWSSPEPWNNAQWATATAAWLGSLPGDRPVYTQYDVMPGISAERLAPAGFLYSLAATTAAAPDQAALEFWLSAPSLVAHDPVGKSVFARWQFNFGAYASARGLPQMSWEAINGALQTTPDDPEIYFSLGRALERGGQVREAAAMYRAATDLAPYRDRYDEAVRRVTASLEAAS